MLFVTIVKPFNCEGGSNYEENIYLAFSDPIFVPMEAGAEIRNSLQQARLAYICALADMAVYDTDMNDVVRQEMNRLGWRFTDYRNKDARANTVFIP